MRHAARWAGLTTTGLLATAALCGAGGRKAEIPATKLNFVETYRYESLTQGALGNTETQTAMRGKTTVTATLPLTGVDVAALRGDTPFALKVGNYQFHATLSSDPNFQPGKTSVRLMETEAGTTGKTRIARGTALLRWNQDRLTVKAEAVTPGQAKTVAAEDLVAAAEGSVKGDTQAEMEFAGAKTTLRVAFQGRVQRKSAGTNFDNHGEAVVVDIRGEGQPDTPKLATP